VPSCNRDGLKVHQGVVCQLLTTIGKVDSVILLDVIERVPDPEHDGFLRRRSGQAAS
jgi:hypothetical protein